MRANIRPVMLAAALAVSTLTALAQPGPAPGAAPGAGPAASQPNPERRAHLQERMKEHLQQRAAALKARLKLNPEQEGAWNTYIEAMKPPAQPPLPKRAEIDKLSTPERLDRMRELRKQREAEFDKRDTATRAFYGTLNADQKKIFDDNTGRPFREGRQWGLR